MTVAVPNPQTWVDGTVYTATDFNREIRDAVGFLLRPPMFHGWATASAAQTDSTWMPVDLNVETLNTEGSSMHSTSTNPSRVYATHDGWWEIVAGASWTHASAGTTGRRIINVRKNGTTYLTGRNEAEAATAATESWARVGQHQMVYLVAGDYVELMEYQSSGVSTAGLWVANDETYPRLIMKWRSKGA